MEDIKKEAERLLEKFENKGAVIRFLCFRIDEVFDNLPHGYEAIQKVERFIEIKKEIEKL